ncbi:MAG: hypothetical protein NTY26_04590, partial [Burkholderiales bacterium]|nr:hypothetical protein [Burkholderiales bacterium]
MARPFLSAALCGLRAFAATWAANWVGACGLIISLATCQLSLPAQATPQLPGYETQTEYYADPSGQHQIDSLNTLAFLPFNRRLALGFEAPPIWLRITLRPLDADAAKAQPLVLRVAPSQIDKLDFYQLVDGQWQATLAGDRRPKQLNPCLDDRICFILNPTGKDTITAYLRLQTHDFPVVTVDLVPSSELMAEVIERVRLTNSALTIAIALLLAGLLLLRLDSSDLVRCFCWYELAVVCHSLSTNASLLRVLPDLQPEWSDGIGDICIWLRTGLLSWGGWLLMAPHQPRQTYKQGVYFGSALVGLMVLAVLIGEFRFAMQVHYVALFLLPVLHLYGSLTTAEVPPSLRKKLLLGWGCLALILIWGYAISLGWHEVSATSLLPADLRLSGVMVGFFTLWIITQETLDRMALSRARLRELEMSALRAKDAEAQHQERIGLIDMLTHELKTPISTIEFAIASVRRLFYDRSIGGSENEDKFMLRLEHIQESTQRMDGLISHAARAMRIEQMALAGPPESIEVSALIQGLLRPYASTHQFSLDVRAGLLCQSHRLLLEAILENLLSNACKYSADNKVCVWARQEGTPALPIVIVGVSNRVSPGAEPDETRLFRRYYRHPKMQNQPGMGLGLSIAQSA